MRVLDGCQDHSAWLDLWGRAGREPFAHPAYSRLFTPPGGRAVLAVSEQPGGPLLVPLLLRTGADLPWLTDTAPQAHIDAISPYGYGGPFGSPGLDVAQALAEVRTWAAELSLCSVFLRLSLDAGAASDPAPDGVAVIDKADNVVVDLRRTPEAIWAGYDHKVRKNVKKALRAGCSVTRDDDFTHLDDFVAVYGATMSRRNAAAWYRFDRAFFDDLAREMRGSFSVFYVRDAKGSVVSAELVLQSDDNLYSFLGGTLAEAFPMSPNDLLKHHVIEYGRESGRSSFVLGGGASPGDGVFAYKRSFDRTGVRPFRTAQIVSDPGRYARLVEQRFADDDASAERQQYFPAYRAP